ncbi:hypothetical protein MASR2M69_18420 [Bacteroidota bacterium]
MVCSPLTKVTAGTTRLEITCLGFQTLTTSITIEKDLDSLKFRLKKDNLKLQSVVVTARENKKFDQHIYKDGQTGN